MKALKKLVFKLLIISGLLFPAQYCFAGDAEQVPITKDENTTPPPIHTNGITTPIPAYVTISSMELAIYFETAVGEATITVTDDFNQVVYLETTGTGLTSEIHIPVDLWTAGHYNLTITYGTTTLRGNFLLD